MTLRTTRKDVTFHNPFQLADLDEVLPAGVYATETEEELLDFLSFTAYRRVRTILQLQPKSATTSTKRSMSIDPDELDAALLRDNMATNFDSIEDASLAPHPDTDDRVERRTANDRADDDGMTGASAGSRERES